MLTFKARYKDGIIKPLEKVDIEDDTEITIHYWKKRELILMVLSEVLEVGKTLLTVMNCLKIYMQIAKLTNNRKHFERIKELEIISID